MNNIAGVVRLDWVRLCSGSENDYYHALTIPDDGSLPRVRVPSPDDDGKLYCQRVTDPGLDSGFTRWGYTVQYNAVVVAVYT